jgi:hypothetical protein
MATKGNNFAPIALRVNGGEGFCVAERPNRDAKDPPAGASLWQGHAIRRSPTDHAAPTIERRLAHSTKTRAKKSWAKK